MGNIDHGLKLCRTEAVTAGENSAMKVLFDLPMDARLQARDEPARVLICGFVGEGVNMIRVSLILVSRWLENVQRGRWTC